MTIQGDSPSIALKSPLAQALNLRSKNPHLLRIFAAWRSRRFEQEEDGSRAVVGINECDMYAIDKQGSVKRQRLNAAGIDAHIFDQQVGGDFAAVDGAGAEGCRQACNQQHLVRSNQVICKSQPWPLG